MALLTKDLVDQHDGALFTLIEHIDSSETLTFEFDGRPIDMEKVDHQDQFNASLDIFNRVGKHIKVTWIGVGGTFTDHVDNQTYVAAHIHAMIDGEWVRIPQSVIEMLFDLAGVNQLRRLVHNKLSLTHILAAYSSEEILSSVGSSVGQMPSDHDRRVDGFELVLDEGVSEQCKEAPHITFKDARDVVIGEQGLRLIDAAKTTCDDNFIDEFRAEYHKLKPDALIATITEAVICDVQYYVKSVVGDVERIAINHIVNYAFNRNMQQFGMIISNS